MNIIGTWKVSHVMAMNGDEELVWVDQEEFKTLPAYDPEDPDALMSFRTVYSFREGGTVYTLMPLPAGVSQQEVDEAVAQGGLTLVDGMIAEESFRWKEEDGTFYLGMDLEGDMHWTDMKVLDDDTLEGAVLFLVMRLRRVREG